MPRFLGPLFVLCFVLGCSQTSLNKSPKTPSRYIQKLGDSTVALVMEVGPGKFHVYCTGIWVGDNAILTAHHCVEGAVDYINKEAKEHFKKEDDDDNSSPPEIAILGAPIHYVLENEVSNVGQEPTAVHLGRVTADDKEHDLALIYALGRAVPPHSYAELAEQSPAIGEKIHVVGHVKGLYWTYAEGTVASYREKMPIDIKGPFMQISAPVSNGNSGGGCFDAKGKLVGVASFIRQGAPDAAFYVHLNNLRVFLDKYLIQHDD